MIRLISLSMCGRAYLNFMGNEFGHLAKVEFPSRKNNFSFAYARRQWDLLDDRDGLHNHLLSFDQVRYYVIILCITVVDYILFGV